MHGAHHTHTHTHTHTQTHTHAHTHTRNLQYHDQLMEDMSLSKRRKGWNCFAECFEPYSAVDYASLFESSSQRRHFKVS